MGDLATGLNYTQYIQSVSQTAIQEAAQTFLPVDAYRSLVMYP
jgi:hypothetical protein